MDWYNEYVTDLFLYNSVYIGLATFSAFLTKRYGVFSGRTISSLIALYTGLLLFMLLNPYYEVEFFNSLFMIAPVIMVRVYYDIRLTYVFMLFIIFASQLKYFLHSTNTVDLSLGLLYLFLSAIIILIPTLKNKTLHTFILFSASYAATILSLFIWPTIAIENRVRNPIMGIKYIHTDIYCIQQCTRFTTEYRRALYNRQLFNWSC